MAQAGISSQKPTKNISRINASLDIQSEIKADNAQPEPGTMNLAINYSPQAASLLKEGIIQLDYFKCPDWPDLIAQAQQLRPAAVHFEIIASAGNLSQKDWSLVDRLLEETGTHYINLHLASNIKDFPGFDIKSPGAYPTPSRLSTNYLPMYAPLSIASVPSGS